MLTKDTFPIYSAIAAEFTIAATLNKDGNVEVNRDTWKNIQKYFLELSKKYPQSLSDELVGCLTKSDTQIEKNDIGVIAEFLTKEAKNALEQTRPSAQIRGAYIVLQQQKPDELNNDLKTFIYKYQNNPNNVTEVLLENTTLADYAIAKARVILKQTTGKQSSSASDYDSNPFDQRGQKVENKIDINFDPRIFKRGNDGNSY
jgi:hypothetical protein